MSILEYNGGCVLAMAGKECVAIASDKRLGVQLTTVAMDANRIFRMHDKLYLGLTGLMTDIQTLDQLFRFKLELYAMRENRLMKPKTFASLVSSTLYSKRFAPYFSEPVIAGLDKDNKPYICSMDLLGCVAEETEFVVAGTCAESLFGTCETFYKKDLEPDELFETVSQALLAALDRDCISGWGAVVHIITKDGVQTKELDGRMD
ncbi:Proteasome subunit beta type-3 [Gracilariopsis chorda]|uniref:Proteasome subunit beta n=1 Tax=Gracilariopsis chorda TaxID=448386 RepID=A0A2V3J6M2_9FLOR|nr:Proteasome subunit beta type-3 [Gracilariopsis chorda]|eukprot:PXF49782.1 Proteasome subunit beta type-3 [Gracilariopsis chorda]